MNPSALLDRNLDFVSKYIDSISETLRPISLKIHDNPELNFEEFIAHKTLVDFMKTRKGWEVTPSAYGIATAFIAVYDSGREGPVISYNAEYGKIQILLTKHVLTQYHRCSYWYRTCMWTQPHCHSFTISITRLCRRNG